MSKHISCWACKARLVHVSACAMLDFRDIAEGMTVTKPHSNGSNRGDHFVDINMNDSAYRKTHEKYKQRVFSCKGELPKQFLLCLGHRSVLQSKGHFCSSTHIIVTASAFLSMSTSHSKTETCYAPCTHCPGCTEPSLKKCKVWRTLWRICHCSFLFLIYIMEETVGGSTHKSAKIHSLVCGGRRETLPCTLEKQLLPQ